jgi:F0F1-type ATP synthase gamma subunit
MQITSAMKMVSAAKQESTRCDYSNAPLCRKIDRVITKPSATLDGDAGGEFTQPTK